jgi:hypothetical protein
MDTSRSRGKIDGQKTLEQQLADDYARITEPQELDPRILGVLRVCLEQIPGRISATPATRRVVIQLIVRLVQVIALHNPDLSGTPREIDLQIAQLIGEHEIGARELYRALVVLKEQTCLVERRGRFGWVICLGEICDPGSKRHRELLQETPSYRQQRAFSVTLGTDPSAAQKKSSPPPRHQPTVPRPEVAAPPPPDPPRTLTPAPALDRTPLPSGAAMTIISSELASLTQPPVAPTPSAPAPAMAPRSKRHEHA